MNDKVKEFLESKKAQEKIKNEKSKTETLLNLGLYEKEYAPIIGYGHTNDENKAVKFPVVNKDIKPGDKIKLAKNDEKIDVTVDSIQCESSAEYAFSEWDQNASMTKYFKKIPVEVTDEEYEEIKKYSSHFTLIKKNKVSSVLAFCAVIVYIIGFISGIALGDALSYNFSWGVAALVWMTTLINGTLLIAVSEIINLLEDIKKK
ncbi:MAG: hypothetical protein E7396_02780 [Ruminococcaceae bacterium]|nr:hypothetical protein [Oscillospiraceae bacterium]